MGEVKHTIELGTWGTPQGAVLSPPVSNVTMKDLSARLHMIPHIKHAIYADDVTVCTCTGSDDEIAESLQATAAADIIQEHTLRNRLTCLPYIGLHCLLIIGN